MLNAQRRVPSSACGEYSTNVNPLPSPVAGSRFLTVSASPPVARTSGYRPVAQAVHLVQAAWLEPRRHQEQVRTPLNQVRQTLVEPDPRADPLRIACGESQPQVLVSSFSRAQQDKARIEPWQVVRQGGQQIESLLVHHPGNHPHKRTRQRRLADRQPVRVQHSALGPGFPLQIRRVVRDGQVRVTRRIPSIVIDSVQNPDEVGGAIPEDAVEAEPKFGRLNFCGIRRADGGDRCD